MIEFKLRGGEYHLYLNGIGLFNIYGKFGQVGNLLDLIEPNNKAGYEATIWILCELSVQGEMYRRLNGYAAEEPLNYHRTLTQVQPHEIRAIKTAVVEALKEGFLREHAVAEDFDPWLEEIESAEGVKKKSRFRSILEHLRQVLASLFRKA